MIHVPPDRVAFEWPLVRAGLLKIENKTGGNELPEQVFHSIMAGQHHLFLHGDGFAVIQFNAPLMFVWKLYFPPGYDKADVVPELDRLARETRCTKIRFHSPRDGWAGFLNGDFKPVATVYERQL